METVTRALQLLKALAQRPMRVQEVAEQVGVHKSTASRLLSSLEKEGFIKLNSERKYELGFAVFELANQWSENLDVRQVARPYLEMLNRKTNETIHLAVLDGAEIVYIDKLDSGRSIRMYSRVGNRAPVYCTGVGKALLAHQPEDVITNIIGKTDFRRYTDTTIIDGPSLKKECSGICADGIAWDRGEHEEEIHCIAAPVFDHRKKAVASVSISAPLNFTSQKVLAEYQDLLLNAVEEISRSLGYVGPWPPLAGK